MKNSTSLFYNINCDRELSKFKKILYLLFNFINNSWFPNISDSNLNIYDFKCSISESDWNDLSIKSTPNRKLSDLFWKKLPWNLIKTELTEINILDIGCGTGRYGVKLMQDSNNSISSYTGFDHKKYDNWNPLTIEYKNFRFKQCNSSRVINHIPNRTNFFMTQSAIEHFDEDLLFFKKLRDYISKISTNVIQIHLFPSSACLKLGLFHGARQYTPRTISRITRLFNEFSYSILYKLGGKACNSLHWKFITKPLGIMRLDDMREAKKEEYNEKAFHAITTDMKYPQHNPTFYALIIHSNYKSKLFLREGHHQYEYN